MLRALRSLVREVDAAVARGDFGELDDLVGRGEPVGHVLQRRAEAERALLHRLRDELLHLLEFRRRRRPIVLADDVVANAAGADERADVDRRTRPLLEPLEVVGRASASPARRRSASRSARRLGNHAVVHRRDRRALAGDLGGDALQ